MKAFFPLMSLLVLAACDTGPFAPANAPVATEVSDDQTRPQARPSETTTAPPPPPSARTAEDFDTTSAAEREAAAAPPETAGERKLGDTIASLGDVTRPGFWLETPLVSRPAQGRVFFPGSGKSAQVDLIPIDGPDTAGSRISLAAMRLIEAPLTDLPTVEVYTGG